MQQTEASLMEVQGLSKFFYVGGGGPFGLGGERRYVHAVEDVSFTLRRGYILALVGESGSGKSTIARLLARLYPPTSGQVRLKGRDVLSQHGHRAMLAYRAEVQMIFQDPFGSLNPVNRIGHHLARPLAIHKGLRGRARDERIRELLSTVGLVPPADFINKYPHQLSGGQRQRVAIARALAVDPKVILADEPVSMLDVSIRMGILNLMEQLKVQRGIAYLYITHDLASARYIADETMVLYAGQMMEKAPSEELMQQPAHPYTRLLLSAVPNPMQAKRRVEARGEIPTIINPKPGCRFAPRCPLAMPICLRRTPEVTEVRPGHLVRCYAANPAPRAVQTR
ncbi:MAG TPA: ABC transporter ATP-binding protein [Chloroflexota bacterium]|nr:ABC transporter ATP-binding protein [Chloroflexota bacterium]